MSKPDAQRIAASKAAPRTAQFLVERNPDCDPNFTPMPFCIRVILPPEKRDDFGLPCEHKEVFRAVEGSIASNGMKVKKKSCVCACYGRLIE